MRSDGTFIGVEVDDSVARRRRARHEARGGVPGRHLRRRRRRRRDRWREPRRVRPLRALPGRLAGRHRQGDQALRRRRAAGEGGLTNPEVTPERFRDGHRGQLPRQPRHRGGADRGRRGGGPARGRRAPPPPRRLRARRRLGRVRRHGGAAWGTFRHLQPGARLHHRRAEGERVRRPGRVGDVLTAIGRPLHVGRRTQVWEVRIQKEGANAAFFTCTQMILTPS